MTAGAHVQACDRCGGVGQHRSYCVYANAGAPQAPGPAAGQAQAYAQPVGGDEASFRLWQSQQIAEQTQLLTAAVAKLERIRFNTAVLIVFLIVIPLVLTLFIAAGSGL